MCEMETTDAHKVDCSLTIGLQTCLGQRWTHEDFSDFTVVVEDMEFECHRFLLASCSGFFSLLLRSAMKENLEKKVTLKNITKETFSVILNCIYKGEDGLTLDNILDVWHATHMLDITYLFKSCEDFISCNINVDNYISFYYHSQFLDSQAVISKVHTFILEHFDHFMTTQTFLELSFEDIHTLIQSTDLYVSSENVVIDAILKWVNFETETISEIKEKTEANAAQKMPFMIPDLTKSSDTQNEAALFRNENDLCITEMKSQRERETRLPTLLSSARLCLCSENYLEKFHFNPLIMSDKDALKLVKDALFYHRNPKLSSNVLINYRQCHDMRNVMAFVNEKQLYFYLLDRKQSIMVMQLESDYESIAACKTTLLLQSKRTEEQAQGRCWYHCFDILNDCKEIKKNIIKMKLTNDLVFLYHHDYFIVIANNIGNQMVQCELKSNERLGLLTIATTTRHHLAYALVHEDNILVFVYNCPGTRIKVYSLDTLQLILEKNIDGEPDGIASFRHKESTYFLQNSGHLWLIVGKRADIDFISVATLWNFTWNLRGAVCYLDELFVFGEYYNYNENEQIISSYLTGVFNAINVVESKCMSNAVFLIISKENYKEFI
ncbi:kelch-like protein 7 [Biomphalaria glabrata]|uniref:Kelch-like protein 7 n=1 Tax=Biomphalaria glabrata TaxID=6526 RepID=A0A9W3BPF0_BIOGL|nr:kelch-like protein 7 [Biomphalaria glabrata]